MATIDELKAQAAAAAAEFDAAKLSPEETELAQLLAKIEESRARTREASKLRRAIRGAQEEAEARAEAKGAYLVKYVDLAAGLPNADPKTLPGEGVIVIRTPPMHPIDVLGNFLREHEAKQRPIPEIFAELVAECIVRPKPSPGEDAKIGGFFNSELGQGSASAVGNVVLELANFRLAVAKRGR